MRSIFLGALSFKVCMRIKLKFVLLMKIMVSYLNVKSYHLPEMSMRNTLEKVGMIMFGKGISKLVIDCSLLLKIHQIGSM